MGKYVYRQEHDLCLIIAKETVSVWMWGMVERDQGATVKMTCQRAEKPEDQQTSRQPLLGDFVQ